MASRMMTRIGGLGRRETAIAIAVLAVSSAVAIWVVREPEREAIEAAYSGYLGDLRNQRFRSAGMRMYPDDLVGLKRAAIELAGEDRAFREATLDRLEAASAEELGAVPKERFYEYLLERTFTAHPEVRQALLSGETIGMRVRRHGDDAGVEATLRVATPEGRRHFVMTLKLRRTDETWFVRL
jgi:hypothetical protein